MRNETVVKEDSGVALKLTRPRIHILLRFIAPYKAKLILTFLLTLFSAAIGLSYPLLAKFLVDVGAILSNPGIALTLV